MKLVLLDREGLINLKHLDSVKSKKELKLLEGVISAIKLLNKASIPVAIVTTQAVVDQEERLKGNLKGTDDHFNELLKKKGAVVDKTYGYPSAYPQNIYLNHKPSLFLDALDDFHVKSHEAIFIGDTLMNLEAASAIKCPCVLIRTEKGIETLQKGLPKAELPVMIFNDLSEGVTHLLNEGTC